MAFPVGLMLANMIDVDLKRIGTVALASLILMAPGQPQQSGLPDPFATLSPELVVSAADRQKLDERQVVLRILPAKDHELAVLTASAINTTAGELEKKVNDIRALKHSSLVPEIGRFSSPPALSDLDSLTLDEDDQDEIRECRPGDCGLKLSAHEIDQLRRAIGGSADERATAAAINLEFRRIILERVEAYLKQGLSGVPEYATDSKQVPLQTAFATLLDHTRFVQASVPDLGPYLTRYPSAPAPAGTTDSFLYWSKETYAWKPIISVTHVTIVSPKRTNTSPELLIVSREVFSTRYTSGGLILTFLLRDSGDAGRHYLVYVNRTWVDGLHALWRPFVNYRIKSQARRVFTAARERIEGTGR